MRHLLSYEEAHFQALQQIEMDEKCHMEREEDKAEATKSKEKPKKSKVLISLKYLIYLQLPSCYRQNEGSRDIGPSMILIIFLISV